MPRFRTARRSEVETSVHRFKPPRRVELISGIKVWIEMQEGEGPRSFYRTTNGQRLSQINIKRWLN